MNAVVQIPKLVTRVLEAKRQHLLARLHCFQVLHQLACEDFGNFHHSYKGMPLYRASRGLCKDTSHPFCRQIWYSRQFKQPLWCWIRGPQQWLQHTIHFPPSVGDWRRDLLCCIQAVFPHIRLVISTFNVVSQAVACGW